MLPRWFAVLAGGVLAVGVWLGGATPARAEQDPGVNRFYHYPYLYFPYDYWPQQSPRWPEQPGQPYMPPPAYMAYPPFREPGWHYHLWEPHLHYRGFHFWLDQF